MSKNIYVKEGDLGLSSLAKASDELGNARNSIKNCSSGTLRSLKFEDANGIDNLFSYSMAAEIGALSGKLKILRTKAEKYHGIMNSAPDRFEEVDKSFKEDFDWKKLGLSILGYFGFAGSLLSAGIQLFTSGKTGIEGGVSALKRLSTIIKTTGKWYKSNKDLNILARMGKKYADGIRHNRLFGFTKIKPSNGFTSWSKWGVVDGKYTPKGWTDRFKGNLRRTESLGSKLKSGATWIGIGLDFVANGISNQDEYKRGEISKGRAFAETVTETAVDFGKDFLIGAAVTAGIAATVGSAPVLAVGAATIAVSTGLDFATKKITYALTGEEKGFTEAVSDVICDAGTAAIKGVSKAGKKMASIVSKITPKISPPKLGLKSLFA